MVDLALAGVLPISRNASRKYNECANTGMTSPEEVDGLTGVEDVLDRPPEVLGLRGVADIARCPLVIGKTELILFDSNRSWCKIVDE